MNAFCAFLFGVFLGSRIVSRPRPITEAEQIGALVLETLATVREQMRWTGADTDQSMLVRAEATFKRQGEPTVDVSFVGRAKEAA